MDLCSSQLLKERSKKTRIAPVCAFYSVRAVRDRAHVASSRTGNKSTLVARLKEFERQQLQETHPTPQSPLAQQQIRLASTTEVPGIPSTSKPSPIPANYPKDFLDVKLPDISQPAPEPPVEIVSNVCCVRLPLLTYDMHPAFPS